MSQNRRENFKKLVRLARLAALAEQLEEEEENANKKRRLWVRDWIAKRQDQVPVFKEVEVEDREKFFTNFRLFPEDFDTLLAR
jgi:hypothetical protein